MKKQQYLDQHWFSLVMRLNANLSDVREPINLKEQKFLFLSDKIENPQFHYPALHVPQISRQIESIQTLQKTIITQDKSPIASIYSDFLEEECWRWKMSLAIATNSIELFQLSSQKLYRALPQTITSQVFGDFYQILSKNLMRKEIIELKLEHLEKYSTHLGNKKSQSSQLAIKKYFLEMNNYVYNMDISDNKQYSAEDIKMYFDQALKHIKASEWKVHIKQIQRENIFIKTQDKTIYIPSSRSASGKVLKQLIAHEINVHVRRAVNGSRSILKLLSVGLSGYILGEEGLALISESALAHNFIRYKGFEKYLAIALASGKDGTVRDFRTVFHIMYQYFLLTYTGKRVSKKTLRERTWQLCVRIFRSIPPTANKGICLTKDAMYYMGQIRIWKLLQDDSSQFEKLFIGKYDPFKKTQIKSLIALGIITG